MVEQVIAACYDKVHLANYVTKYRSFVLQGHIYNNNNNNNNNNNKHKHLYVEIQRMWNMKYMYTGNNRSHQNSNERF